jgi:Fic family protein
VALAANRARYIEGLETFREGDVPAWISLFAAAAAHAAELASAHLRAVRSLQESWRESLRQGANPRSDGAAWLIIDALPGHPVVTLPVAVTAVRRSKAVVNSALVQLEEAGVLVRIGGGERNRTWEAAGLLDLLGALEAAAGPPAARAAPV